MKYWTHVFLISTLYSWRCWSLKCYECSAEMKEFWDYTSCQLNATDNPVRTCNDDQEFCYVELVTVKGRIKSIKRDCVNECYYGCVARSFGVMSLTCTTCCRDDKCNTGSTADTPLKAPGHIYLLPLTLLLSLL